MNDTSTRMWVALFVALVFVCGLSMGLAAGLWLGPRAGGGPFRGAPWGERGPTPGPRALAPDRLLNRLEREDAQFSAAQRAQLEALFEARRRAFERVAREMRQRFTAEQERLRAGVAEILTPEQMELFDRLRRRQRSGAGPGREGGPRGQR